jgi:uncharacterized protein
MAGWLALDSTCTFITLCHFGLGCRYPHGAGRQLAAFSCCGTYWPTDSELFLVFLVGGPLGEELGWRGYALPTMQERMGWRSAGLVLGFIWGVWHLPLFFIAGSSQNNGSMVVFFVLIMASSVFYTWLYNRSEGSVLPALVLHTASNTWPFVVPVLPSDTDQRPYHFVVSLVIIAAIWLLLRRDRNQPNKGLAS